MILQEHTPIFLFFFFFFIFWLSRVSHFYVIMINRLVNYISLVCKNTITCIFSNKYRLTNHNMWLTILKTRTELNTSFWSGTHLICKLYDNPLIKDHTVLSEIEPIKNLLGYKKQYKDKLQMQTWIHKLHGADELLIHILQNSSVSNTSTKQYSYKSLIRGNLILPVFFHPSVCKGSKPWLWMLSARASHSWWLLITSSHFSVPGSLWTFHM